MLSVNFKILFHGVQNFEGGRVETRYSPRQPTSSFTSYDYIYIVYWHSMFVIYLIICSIV